jgi:hypothetical protein
MSSRAVRSTCSSRFPAIREATFEDYPQIAALSSRYLPSTPNTFEEWQHLWSNNPVYDALKGKWPIGWVLESENQVLGYIGNIPFQFELHNRKILAAVGCAYVVDQRCRAYAMLVADHFFNQKGAELVLSTSTNPESYEVFRMLEAVRVPVGAWDRTGMWITDYPGFAAGWMKRKGWPWAWPLNHLLGSAMFFREKVDRSLAEHPQPMEVTSCSGFDEGFDVFWQELKSQNPDKLLALRDRESLTWHFKRALLGNKLWIATVTKDSRLISYGVLIRKERQSTGTARMLFVDFQAIEDPVTSFASVLTWALRRCRQEGIQTLENIGLHLGTQDIGHFAPYIRQRPAWSYLYKSHNPSLTKTLADPEVWAPSSFDSDTTM